MLDSFFLPFQLPFMQKAFLITMIMGVSMALLSCFLVLRGWSLIGDAISHAVLPGIVLAYVLNISLLIGAFCAGILCSSLIGYIEDNSRLKRDAVMGVVFSAMFSTGLVLYIWIPSNLHLNHILFGSILGVSQQDLWQSGIITSIICFLIVVGNKDLLLCSFDKIQARVSGIHVSTWHYILLGLVSLAIVATLKIAGIIMAIGLLIIPGSTAYLLCRRMMPLLWISVIITELASVLGIYMSFHWDTAPGPTIILVLSLFFILAFIWRILITKLSLEKFKNVRS